MIITTQRDEFDPISVNKNLVYYYGKEIDGRPRFRLVWADDQREKRIGEFNEFYGDIFIRTRTGVQELPKYDWIHARWVLEKLVFHYVFTDILTDQKGSYECVWVFSDSEGNYLTPHWWAVDYAIKALLNRHVVRSHIGGDKVARNEFEEAKRKRRVLFREILDDDAFYGKLNPKSGEGVSFSDPWMIQKKEKTQDKTKANEIVKRSK